MQKMSLFCFLFFFFYLSGFPKAPKSKEARGLPTKLGAKVTVAGEGAGPALVRGEEEPEEAPLSKDSMRMSSLGEWLSSGPEQKVTNEEKTGIIGYFLFFVLFFFFLFFFFLLFQGYYCWS